MTAHLDLDGLADLLAGEGGDDDLRHVSGCARCSAALAEVEQAQGPVRQALAALPEPVVPADLAARLDAALLAAREDELDPPTPAAPVALPAASGARTVVPGRSRAVARGPGLFRVAAGAAAVLVLALALRDALLRPRLAAGPGGVQVRTLTGRVHLPWPVLRVRVRTSRRLGVRHRTLELDTATGPDDDGVLVVLGRRDLGADPDEVARALLDLDPTAPRGR